MGYLAAIVAAVCSQKALVRQQTRNGHNFAALIVAPLQRPANGQVFVCVREAGAGVIIPGIVASVEAASRWP